MSDEYVKVETSVEIINYVLTLERVVETCIMAVCGPVHFEDGLLIVQNKVRVTRLSPSALLCPLFPTTDFPSSSPTARTATAAITYFQLPLLSAFFSFL